MRCPFLREAQVKHCRASTYRKMIVRSQDDVVHERCTSAAYRECPALQSYSEDSALGTRCPFLQESLVQYCAASAVTRFIPYSESSLIRCGTNGHRYCDVYLAVAGSDREPATGQHPENSRDAWVDGIRLPAGLAFTANHLWFDEGSDGSWHVGVDAFLARTLHRVSCVNALTSHGTMQPTAVLSVGGVELQFTFPQHLTITATNPALRTDPQRLCAHPYTSGWIFEGTSPGTARALPADPPAPSWSRRGPAAAEWMHTEVRRLQDFLHNQILPARSSGSPVLMDGGSVAPGFILHLDRQEILQLYNDFFSLNTARRL